MTYIKAPYNFVPLSDKVFCPDWADEVSHDIPFEDGISGTINLKMTAMTPVFVRNGHTSDTEKDSETHKEFSNYKGKYFIPGTSIKGMLRNVLEIISFGKMHNISDDRYALRDLQNRNDYMNEMTGGKTYCGWLTIPKNGQNIEIEECNIPGRISHKEIDNILKSNFASTFSNQELLRSDNNRTAMFKYEKVKKANLVSSFEHDADKNKNRSKVDKREFFKYSDKGKNGTIVFTGQPGPRHKRYDQRKMKELWSGKFYEFIFFKSGDKRLQVNKDSELWNDFLFIYKDSEDWKYLKNNFIDIPVFYKKNDQGNISSIGLSYLYKLPYRNRIKDCLPESHKTSKADLCDLIFGNSLLGLKGRIRVSHAFLNKGEIVSNTIAPLMGSPKASYYPAYLRQDGNNGITNLPFKTYMNENARLKGWKRYPVHKESISAFQVEESQKNNTSPFLPLDKDAEFSFKISFHNLKKCELGGLINAITLCQTKESFHSIGFAKPYGYGKIKLSIENPVDFEVKEVVNEFNLLMEQIIPNWLNSDQMIELITMAQDHETNQRSDLSYMQLADFPKMKNRNNPQFLDYYSYLVGKSSSNKTRPPAVNNVRVKIEELPDITIKETIKPEKTWIKAKIIKSKTVQLESQVNPVQLVIPKHKGNIELVNNQEIWVEIKQKSNAGNIVQVEYKGFCE